MLKIIQETKTLISLLHDDCTIDKTIVQSIVFDFIKPFKKRLTLSASTIPTAQNFIDSALTTLYNITSASVDKTEFNDGIYELNYWILKFPLIGSFNYLINTNLINGVNILNAFNDTNWIYLDDFYEIDKTKSTQDQLFLKKPVKTLVTAYNPAYKNQEYFAKICGLNNKIKEEISKITPCTNCGEGADSICDKLIMLISIQNNISCKNLEGAKTIFKYLNNIYEKC